jgi:solute carrier family 26 (sodium-independent sulfate anion transporter), member 11
LSVKNEKFYVFKGDIKPGLPPFEAPHFNINKTTGNFTQVVGFGDVCMEIGTAIGLVPLIAILEQIAIAKAFGNLKKKYFTSRG